MIAVAAISPISAVLLSFLPIVSFCRNHPDGCLERYFRLPRHGDDAIEWLFTIGRFDPCAPGLSGTGIAMRLDDRLTRDFLFGDGECGRRVEPVITS